MVFALKTSPLSFTVSVLLLFHKDVATNSQYGIPWVREYEKRHDRHPPSVLGEIIREADLD